MWRRALCSAVNATLQQQRSTATATAAHRSAAQRTHQLTCSGGGRSGPGAELGVRCAACCSAECLEPGLRSRRVVPSPRVHTHEHLCRSYWAINIKL